MVNDRLPAQVNIWPVLSNTIFTGLRISLEAMGANIVLAHIKPFDPKPPPIKEEITLTFSGSMPSMLGIDPEKVRVISSFIGGGFGSKGFMWANTILAPMASKLIRRPVKIVLERTGQMFTCAGRRSFTIQKIDLGADQSGKFNSVKHDTTSETSFVDEFIETAGIATKMLYN